jgi:pimeloyl-ACP methyl ester carboxylesterase
MKKTIISIILLFTITNIFGAQLNIKSKQLQINNNQIHYYEIHSSSKKPNLIMLTGIATTANFWPKNFITDLAKEYNLYILDYRSFNTNQDGDNLNYSIDELANDTNLVVKKLKLNNIYLLGWSMGGAVTQQIIFDDQLKVNQAFLISPAVPLKSSKEFSKKINKKTPILKTKSDIYNFVFNNNLYNYSSKDLDSLIKEFINPDITKLFPNNKTYAKQKTAINQWVNSSKNLDKFININTPITVFLAKNDTILNPQETLSSLELIKNKSLVNIINFDKSGHAIDWQYPQKLATLINTLK